MPLSVLIAQYLQVKSWEEQTDLLQWCGPPPTAVHSQLWWLDRLHHGFLPKPAPDEFRHLLVCLPCSISYYHRWVLVFAFHLGKADYILILCAFINVFVIGTSLASRSSWPQGAKTGRRISKSPHCLLKGTREWKWLWSVPHPAQLSFSSSGQTPWTEDSMHTGSTAHLLSKTGGPGPPTAHSGKDLFGHSAILIKQTQVHYLYNGECSVPHEKLSCWMLIRLTHVKNEFLKRHYYFSNFEHLKLNVGHVWDLLQFKENVIKRPKVLYWSTQLKHNE